jgi:hypothetical protein
MQKSASPSWRKVPLAHAVHCESVALVQVTGTLQFSTALQGWQLPSACAK